MADIKKTIELEIIANTGDIEKYSGSLDEVQNKVAEISKVANNTVKFKIDGIEKTTTEIEQLTQATQGAVNETENLGDSANDTSKKSQSLKQELRAITTRLAELTVAGETTSEEFKNLSARGGEIRDSFDDVNRSLAANKSFADASIGALQGIAGGFAVAQGAAGLFGGESENVQKALLKVQSALAIVQGIEAFKDAIPSIKAFGKGIVESSVFLKANAAATNLTSGAFKLMGISVETSSVAFKGLKTAIAATGIGLLVVGLGELIANFDKIKSALGGTTELQKGFADAAKQAQTNAFEESQSIIVLNKVLNDQNASLDVKKEAYAQLQKDVPALKDMTYEEALATGVLTKAIGLQIKAIEARAFAEVFAKKAAEEAGKQAEIQNRTLEESLNWYESALFSARRYFKGQNEYDEKQYGLRAAKNNNEELGKSQKLQEAYTGEFEKYLNIALTNEAELTKIEAAGTKGKKAKTDANANYLKQLEKNRAAAKGEYDDALRQANLDRDNALKLAKNREEEIAIESKYAQTLSTIKTTYAKAVFDNTEKQKRDARTLALELFNIDKERLDSQKKLNDEIIKINEDRTLSAEEREKKIKEIQDQYAETSRQGILQANELELALLENSGTKKVDEIKKNNERIKVLRDNIAIANYDDDVIKFKQAEQEKLDALKKQKDDELALYKGNAEKIDEINKQYKEAEVVIKKDTDEKIKQADTQKNNALKKNSQDLTDSEKQQADQRQKLQQQLYDKSVELANSLADLAKALLEVETAKINEEYDKRIQAQQDRNSEELSNLEITSEQRTELERMNAEEIVALEDEKAAKLKEIKKKQADIDFAITVANIIASTAAAIAFTIAQLGGVGAITPPGAALIALMGVIGATQIGVAIAQRQAVQGLAAGGMVIGEGGPTDDLVPIMASNGEAVINARAVRRYAPILSAINQSTGGAPIIPKFRAGGAIGANPGDTSISDINQFGSLIGGSAVRAYILSSDVSSDTVRNQRIQRNARIN